MNTLRTRLMVVTGATLALVMAGTAVATAHPGRHDDDREFGFGFGFGRGPVLERFGTGDWDGLGLGRFGPGMALFGLSDGVVRTETTLDLGDDGIVTHRSDSGTVTTAGDAALEYTLATGESASVTTDEDTAVLALSEESEDDGFRSFHRVRLSADEVALADIAAGSDVMVWATSQEDGSYLASRIVVRPVASDLDADDAEAADAASEPTEEATSDA